MILGGKRKVITLYSNFFLHESLENIPYSDGLMGYYLFILKRIGRIQLTCQTVRDFNDYNFLKSKNTRFNAFYF